MLWHVVAPIVLVCTIVVGRVAASNSTNASGIDPLTGKSCEPNCAELIARARAANEELTKRLASAEAAKSKLSKLEEEKLRALSLSRSLDPDKYSIGGDGDHGGMTSSLLDPTKFAMVEPPTKCPNYDCAKMLVKYLQTSTQRGCVAGTDRTQQFKRIGCSGFEIMDGDCDIVKARPVACWWESQLTAAVSSAMPQLLRWEGPTCACIHAHFPHVVLTSPSVPFPSQTYP